MNKVKNQVILSTVMPCLHSVQLGRIPQGSGQEQIVNRSLEFLLYCKTLKVSEKHSVSRQKKSILHLLEYLPLRKIVYIVKIIYTD